MAPLGSREDLTRGETMPDNSELPLDRRTLLLGLALTSPALADVHASSKKKPEEEEKEVTANEDLMREHGVIRRALLVYTAVASRIRKGAVVDAGALNRTAR